MVEDSALTYRDFADSVRLEVSMLSPEKEIYMREATILVRNTVERMYGKYFGPNTLNRVRGLEDRIVTFCPGSLVEYLRVAGSDLEDRLVFVKGVHMDRIGGDIIGLASKQELAQQPDIKALVDSITARSGIAREIVEQNLTTAALEHNLMHEIFHAYEVSQLPPFFDECAVPYYVTELQEELKGYAVYASDGVDRAAFYRELIERFGEGVHGLFFGLVRNKEYKKEVLAAYTPEIKKRLFPEGYGTTKKELKKFDFELPGE